MVLDIFIGDRYLKKATSFHTTCLMWKLVASLLERGGRYIKAIKASATNANPCPSRPDGVGGANYMPQTDPNNHRTSSNTEEFLALDSQTPDEPYPLYDHTDSAAVAAHVGRYIKHKQ